MKKVLHFIGSLEMGGTENMLLTYLKNTKSREVEHVVCTLYSRGSLEREFVETGVQIFCLGIKSKALLPLAVLRFRGIVNKLKPDIIHSYLLQENTVARIVGKLTKTRVICGKRDTDRYKAGWKVALDKATLSMGNLNVSNSKEGMKELLSYGLPKEKVAYIPNGKDMEKFGLDLGKPGAKKKLGFAEEEILLGCIARLYEFKGQEYLIRALPDILKKYRDARVVLVGGGKCRENLRELALLLGVEKEVVFLGERKDIPRVLEAFDVFVFPSLREGMPGALMEAMACGLPVIATNIDGNLELVVDGENGILVEPKNPKEISKKVIEILENEELEKKLGGNARKTIGENFSIENMVMQLDSLYENF